MSRSLIMSGMVAALGSMLLVGGCKTEVMGERGYIPAEKSPAPMAAVADETAAPAVAVTETVTVTEEKPLPSLDEAVPKKAVAASSAKKVVASTSGSYVVKSGDTIGSIAKAHGIGPSALLAANGMTNDDARKLKVGRKLVIPAKGVTASLASTAAKSAKSAPAKNSAKPVVGAKEAAAPAAADGATYVVKAGDSIPKIAKQLGVKSSELMAANHLDEAATRRLKIGQKLVIPGKGAVAAAATAAAAPVQNDAALDAAASALSKAPAAPAAADSAAPVTAVPAAAATAATPAAAAPAAAAAAAKPAEQAVTGSSVPVEILEDIKLEDFTKNQKITIDVFKKMNPDVVVTDGVLKTNTVVFVPGAE